MFDIEESPSEHVSFSPLKRPLEKMITMDDKLKQESSSVNSASEDDQTSSIV
jgi:hypothetical protein